MGGILVIEMTSLRENRGNHESSTSSFGIIDYIPSSYLSHSLSRNYMLH